MFVWEFQINSQYISHLLYFSLFSVSHPGFYSVPPSLGSYSSRFTDVCLCVCLFAKHFFRWFNSTILYYFPWEKANFNRLHVDGVWLNITLLRLGLIHLKSEKFKLCSSNSSWDRLELTWARSHVNGSLSRTLGWAWFELFLLQCGFVEFSRGFFFKKKLCGCGFHLWSMVLKRVNLLFFQHEVKLKATNLMRTWSRYYL